MKYFKTSLVMDDIAFFYQILYQFEKESSHNGYNYSKVSEVIKSTVLLERDSKKKRVMFIMPQNDNSLVLTGNKGNVSRPIIEQIRHAFAHALIEERGGKFIINEKLCSKCKLCGIVDKTTLKNYLSAIIDTRSY